MKNIEKDFIRISNNKKKYIQNIKIILFSHSFHLVFCYRLGVFVSRFILVGPIFRVMLEYFIRIYFGSDISLKCQIGPGLVIIHGHDIVIGSSVIIGKNCKIFNGVTLGNKNTETNLNEQPIIGDSVVISTGAKILGNITIGDNVIIGANSVVINDIPSNSVAVGIPSRVIKRNNENKY